MSDKSVTQFNESNTTDWLIQFKSVYQHLSKKNLESLTRIYHNDIVFEDPLHKVEGLNNVIIYFNNLYTHITSCTFDITHTLKATNEAAIYWHMHFKHPKLNSGKTITVIGHSHLKAMNNKIIYHRDYLDVGAMIYEHIPVLGHVVRFLKHRVSQ